MRATIILFLLVIYLEQLVCHAIDLSNKETNFRDSTSQESLQTESSFPSASINSKQNRQEKSKLNDDQFPSQQQQLLNRHQTIHPNNLRNAYQNSPYARIPSLVGTRWESSSLPLLAAAYYNGQNRFTGDNSGYNEDEDDNDQIYDNLLIKQSNKLSNEAKEEVAAAGDKSLVGSNYVGRSGTGEVGTVSNADTKFDINKERMFGEFKMGNEPLESNNEKLDAERKKSNEGSNSYDRSSYYASIQSGVEQRQLPKAMMRQQSANGYGNLEQMQGRAPFSDVYFVAIVACLSTVAIFSVIFAGYCYYRIQQSNKAAADVDYPAYGVVGPGPATKTKETNTGGNVSPSGDRKLAQSAQMYHYHHQKQQMIASEKASTGPRHTSASDAESDDENEEGEYTVYECPGLAPTGEMEVKNPLFNDDLTPVNSMHVTGNSKEK